MEKHSYPGRKLEETGLAVLYGYKENKKPKSIARELGIDLASVYRHLHLARERGAISGERHIDAARYPIIEEDIQLESQLRKAFPLLHSAFVVQMIPKLTGEGAYDLESDIILHRILGIAAAQELNQRLRWDDRIGVGGGYAMRALAECFTDGREQIKVDGLEVYSLAGGRSYEPHHSPYTARASANQVTLSLAGMDGHFIYHGAYANANWKDALYIEALGENAQAVSLISGNDVRPLDMAIFEIGAVHTESHFPTEVLDREDLVNIDIQSSVANQPTYHPLFECLNRLTVVNPLTDVSEFPELQNLLQELSVKTQRINPLAVGADEEFLMRTHIRIGVGGGVHKAAQIYHAINTGLINHLVVDSTTARRVLERPRG